MRILHEGGDPAALAVVWATGTSGQRLREVVARVRRFARATDGGAIVVTTAADAGDRVEGATLLHAPAATLGAALALGVREAGTRRCLLLDDEIEVDETAVAAHRDADRAVVSVGPLDGLPPRWTPVTRRDAHPMLALARARNCAFPSSVLDGLAAGALDDPVACFRLGRELLDAGIAIERIDAAAARWRGRPAAVHALGAAALRLYREAPETLADSGIGAYVRTPGRASRFLRAALLRLPAGVLVAVAGRRPPDAVVEALWWHGVRREAGRAAWRRLASGVTILMLHGFTANRAASRYVMPARRLRRRLRLLRMLRKRVLTLDEYVRLRERHELPPARTVVITIDDGYDETYTLAAPLLRRLGMPATVFVVTRRIGARNDWDADGPLRDRPLAGWPQLRAGLADGLALGAHTRTHARLPVLDDDALEAEVAGSRDDLSEALGHGVRTFAYPYGEQDERAVRAVAAAGFAAACSARPGLNDHGEPLALLRRVEAWGNDPLWRFAAAIVLGRRTL